MNFLPFENISINSEKSEHELVTELKKNAEVSVFQLVDGPQRKPLVGKVNGSKFKVYRSIKYKNAFLPVAHGEIESTEKNTIIKLKLQMHFGSFAFVGAWLSGAFFITLKALFLGVPEKAIVPALMFAFVYMLMLWGFWYEVPKLKEIFEQLAKKNS